MAVFLYCFVVVAALSNALFVCGSQLVGLPPVCRGAFIFLSRRDAQPSAMATQRSSTSKSLVKVVVAAALGMLLSNSGSLPPVAVGPSTVRVYHYTNKAGYEGIVESGHIKPLDIKQGDVFYGSGVYGTQLDPSTPVYTILHNNYNREGGINGRGKSKMDRADYVFALDLPESSVVFVDTNGSRSVLFFGGGKAVPVGEATFHGPADDVALELERELKFQEFLSQDPVLAKAWQLYRLHDNDVRLKFVYMGKLDYQKKLDLKQNGTCSWDVPARVSNLFWFNYFGKRKVLVMLTSDGNVPGRSGDWEQCILHSDIDSVESDLVCKLEQWTKHWVDLVNYPLDHRVVPQSLDFLTKLRREVAARDCYFYHNIGDRIIFLFASSGDKYRSIELLRDYFFCCYSRTEPGNFYGLNITSLKQQAEGKDKAYVFVAASKSTRRLDWNRCLLYGDIEQVFSTLDSWHKQHSRVTTLNVGQFRYSVWTKWI